MTVSQTTTNAPVKATNHSIEKQNICQKVLELCVYVFSLLVVDSGWKSKRIFMANKNKSFFFKNGNRFLSCILQQQLQSRKNIEFSSLFPWKINHPVFIFFVTP